MPKYTQDSGRKAVPDPLSPALAGFIQKTEQRAAARKVALAEQAAHAAALGLPAPAKPATKRVPKGAPKVAKKAGKSAALDADLSSRYYGNKSVPKDHPKAKLESNWTKAEKVSQFLKEKAYSFDDIFWKSHSKIGNCCKYGAFRVLSPTVAYNIGKALCKTRVCPICQRVLAYKRQTNFMGFVDVNRKQLSKYYFYHLVLTVRHSAIDEVRNYLYVSDLLDYFKKLRGVTGGKMTEQRSWWDQRVAGGVYSIETTPGADGSPHIHLHVLLMGKMPLWSARRDRPAEFERRIKADWLSLTGDSTQVHVEPVFTWKKDEDGNPLRDAKGKKIKDYARKVKFGGEGFEQLREAVAECAKYTLKTDSESLSQFTDEFLHDFMATRHRYYGRFGALHAKHPDSKQFKELKRLNSDFQDLDEVDAKEATKLWDPERQVEVPKSETKTGITAFSNTKARTAPMSAAGLKDAEGRNRGGEAYYEIQDYTKFAEYQSLKELPKALNLTIYRPLDAESEVIKSTNSTFSTT